MVHAGLTNKEARTSGKCNQNMNNPVLLFLICESVCFYFAPCLVSCESVFSPFNIPFFLFERRQFSAQLQTVAGPSLWEQPSCSSRILCHAPTCTRRLQAPLKGSWCHLSNLIFTYKYRALCTFPLSRKTILEKGRGAGGVLWLLISFVPALARPSPSVWSCQAWQSGLGLELRREGEQTGCTCRALVGSVSVLEQKPISWPVGC